MKDLKTLLIKAVSGIKDYELKYSRKKKMEIQAFRGEIANFTSSDNKSVSSHIIKDKKLGKSASEMISEDSIKNLLTQAEENSRFAGVDSGNVLYTKGEKENFPVSGSISSLSLDEKKSRLLASEKAALDYDPRIANIPECNYNEIVNESLLINSYGLEKSQGSSFCYAMMEVIAREGDETQTAYDVIAAPTIEDLDLIELAKTTAQKALDKMGAQEIDSGEYPIVFDSDSASELLDAFIAGGSSPFFGVNIQKKRSMLADKLGEKIGSDLFTVIDSPREGMTPTWFDSNGVPTANLTLVKKGVFTNVVHSLYSAAREEGAVPTGHGQGSGTSLHHAYLEQGEGNMDGLLKKMDKGLLLTEIEGLHAGLNVVTGDFSLSAKGFLIENGKRGQAVRNLVAAGNFFDLAKGLIGKAADARDTGIRTFNSPSILIEKLSISGK